MNTFYLSKNDLSKPKLSKPYLSTSRRLRDRFKTGAIGLTLTTLALGIAPIAKAQDAPAKTEAKADKSDTAVQTPAQTPASGQAEKKQNDPNAAKDAQPAAQPAAPAGPKPGAITISGLVDFYLGNNFRRPGNPAASNPFRPSFTGALFPNGGNIRIDNAGRFNDINDNELTFSLGELDITRLQDRKLPLGFRATLTVGEAPRYFHGTEPGGTEDWQTFHNLYVSHTFRAANRDVEIDFGKWASPFGIEVLESNQNDNYSRGYLYFFSPFYHAGVRAKFPLSGKLAVEAGLVNGWNNVADDNDAKSAYLQLTLKPNPRYTQIFSYIGGAEGTGMYGVAIAPKNQATITTHHIDADSIYQITPNFKIAGWLFYGSGAGTTAGKHVSGNWLGMAAYARYQIDPRLAVAGRVEQFEDIPGAGGVGLRVGGGYTKLRSLTATLEYALFKGRLLPRLEYRHDIASSNFFGYGNSAAGPDQDTLTASTIYKF